MEKPGALHASSCASLTSSSVAPRARRSPSSCKSRRVFTWSSVGKRRKRVQADSAFDAATCEAIAPAGLSALCAV